MYRLVQKKRSCFAKHQPGATRQNFLSQLSDLSFARLCIGRSLPENIFINVTCRDIVVAPVPLTALGAPPVLVPDVVADGHVAVDLLVALVLCRAALRNVILLLCALKEGSIIDSLLIVVQTIVICLLRT